MAHAYTPGLRVTERAPIRKERRLPITGEVLVKAGERVSAEKVVARTELPGDVATVNVVNQLAISPSELPRHMLKREGERVARDEPIAETKPLINWFKRAVRSPVDGVIESVSNITGQVLIRTAPRRVELTAYVDGVVAEVFEGEGVAVETTGALVQGIFGVGGETHGEVVVAAESPEANLRPDDLKEDHVGKIVVGGSLVTSEVYERASAIGVAALVCGGFHDRDLRRLLGYDLGVAITGHEPIRPTLIITEGFGPIAMAEGTFALLKTNEGRRASANGATQIRAGVLRPEIIIPRPDLAGGEEDERPAMGLTVGSPVRIIREPGFGKIGRVRSLPAGLQEIETEARVRVVEVEFPEGHTAIVPRANVEAIEK